MLGDLKAWPTARQASRCRRIGSIERVRKWRCWADGRGQVPTLPVGRLRGFCPVAKGQIVRKPGCWNALEPAARPDGCFRPQSVSGI